MTAEVTLRSSGSGETPRRQAQIIHTAAAIHEPQYRQLIERFGLDIFSGVASPNNGMALHCTRDTCARGCRLIHYLEAEGHRRLGWEL